MQDATAHQAVLKLKTFRRDCTTDWGWPLECMQRLNVTAPRLRVQPLVLLSRLNGGFWGVESPCLQYRRWPKAAYLHPQAIRRNPRQKTCIRLPSPGTTTPSYQPQRHHPRNNGERAHHAPPGKTLLPQPRAQQRSKQYRYLAQRGTVATGAWVMAHSAMP